MTDDTTQQRLESAAQHLRVARDDLQEVPGQEATFWVLAIAFFCTLAEEHLTKQYEETKGRSPE